MQITKHIIIALTVTAIGLAGNAQAGEGGDRKGGKRDSHSVQHRGYDSDRFGRHGHQHGGARSERFAIGFENRQDRQIRRIRKGVRSGELTRSERRQLKRQQRRIARLADRYSADGRYSKHERRRLERAQDRASRRIYDAKHNDRYYRALSPAYGHDHERVSLIWHFGDN